MLGSRTLAAVVVLVSAAGAQQFTQTARLHFPVDMADANRTTLADLDGDGDADVIGTNTLSGSGIVRIYRNDGRGRFTADPRFTPMALQTGHAVGDIDGDGDQDVVLRGWVLRNQGPGSLQSVPVAIGEDPIRAADLNGDGRADVVTARVNSGPANATTTITTWLAGPGLTFTPVTVLTIAQTFADVALADFDRDGDLDLLIGTSPNGIFTPQYSPGIERMVRNDGGGVFTENAAWLPNPIDDYTGPVAVADFDRDGDLDCACYSSPPFVLSGWAFRINDGTGRLLPWPGPVVPGLANGAPPHLVVDLDGDGAPDLVRKDEWWRNDSLGNFQRRVLAGCPARALHAAGDLDGDGDVDLVFGGNGGNGSSYRLLLDQGGQSFVDATAYAWEPLGLDVITGDVDGDGDLDLLQAGGHLQLNDGSGHFTSAPFPWSGPPQHIRHHFADVDLDGDQDVLYSTVITGPVELRFGLSDGIGHFVDPAPALPQILVPAFPTASAAFDADGDADVDLVCGTSGSGLLLLRNNGAFGFPPDPSAFAAFPDNFAAIGAADFDRDGDIDVLTAHQNWGIPSPALHMLVNDGTGHFTDMPSRLVVAMNMLMASNLCVFDADGDGDPDVVIGNNATSSYDWRHRFLRNDGTGRLVENASALPNLRANQGVGVGDFDGDGDIDIVATTWTSGLRCWRNNGQGVFTDVSGIDVPTYNVGFTLPDLDGDGDADLVAGDRILRSRQWDATAPHLPQLGRNYVVQFSSIEQGGGFAVPWFSPNRVRVPMVPFGTIGVDLATGTTMSLTPIIGIGTYTLSVPGNPGLLGLSFGIQAALIGGLRPHLTPPVYDVVRN